MTKGSKQRVVWVSTLALAGLLAASVLIGLRPGTTVRADFSRSDFALLDTEPSIADKSVQCGATASGEVAPRVVET